MIVQSLALSQTIGVKSDNSTVGIAYMRGRYLPTTSAGAIFCLSCDPETMKFVLSDPKIPLGQLEKVWDENIFFEKKKHFFPEK